MKKLLYTLLSLILLVTAVSCQKSDEPISVTQTLHGCEFTITLDKSKYGLGDTGTATVSLVNKSGKDIKLYSHSENEFIEVYFLEDGEAKFSNVAEVGRDITVYEAVPDGESFEYEMVFDLDAPEGTQEPLKTDSEWKIKAKASILIDPDGEKRGEDISVEIAVPH